MLCVSHYKICHFKDQQKYHQWKDSRPLVNLTFSPFSIANQLLKITLFLVFLKTFLEKNYLILKLIYKYTLTNFSGGIIRFPPPPQTLRPQIFLNFLYRSFKYKYTTQNIATAFITFTISILKKASHEFLTL